MMPLALNRPLPPAVTAKKTKTRTRAGDRAELGPAEQALSSETLRTRSSDEVGNRHAQRSAHGDLAAGPNAARPPSFAYRLPCLASSMTEAAASLVTKPGPVG